VSKLYWSLGLWLLVLVGTAGADTFNLTSGETITGEVLTSSANDVGLQIKVDEGKYERVSWASFSQDDLKKFAKVQKFQAFVEPFIETTPEEKIKKTEVPNMKQPPRLERPERGSVLGALFSSGLGFFVLLALYAANIYAAYEVAVFRGRPPLLVAGSAAIPFLGFLSPIVFLSMPTDLSRRPQQTEEAPSEPAPSSPAIPTTKEVVNPMLDEHVAHPTALKLAQADTDIVAKPAAPQTVTYQRGQFTFNRRFFETKFVGFFSVVRRDADRDMVLVIKSSRGEYIGERISRIAAHDLHLQVRRGGATEEVMIPFQEIQEIRLQHQEG
jgi:hypothetical protein